MFHEEIKKVRVLLNSPEAWTQYSLARDEDKKPIEVDNPDACKWCIQGAFMHVTNVSHPNDLYFDKVWRYVNGKSQKINGYGLLNFNDNAHTEHSDIIGFMDALIA